MAVNSKSVKFVPNGGVVGISNFSNIGVAAAIPATLVPMALLRPLWAHSKNQRVSKESFQLFDHSVSNGLY